MRAGHRESKEERDFDERVLSEVLDSAPSVMWDDVAGLAAAKQVGTGDTLGRKGRPRGAEYREVKGLGGCARL